MFLMLPLTFPIFCGVIGIWLYQRHVAKQANQRQRLAQERQDQKDCQALKEALPSASLDDLNDTLAQMDDPANTNDPILGRASELRQLVLASIASRQAAPAQT